MHKDFLNQLKKNLVAPLPGKEAHYRMAPTIRRQYAEAPADAKVACVMALFYPSDQIEKNLNLVLIERRSSKNPNDVHSGQIGFPGGKLEPDDQNLEAAALRETEEEVGILRNDIQMLGSMTDLYIPVSYFKVYPFVGYLPYQPVFTPQETEVRSILEVPFHTLQDESVEKVKDLRVREDITMKNVPYFDIQGHVVWGATAMMLSELLEVTPKIETNYNFQT